MGHPFTPLGRAVQSAAYPDSPAADGTPPGAYYTRLDGGSAGAQDLLLRATLGVQQWKATVSYTAQEVSGAAASGSTPATPPSYGPASTQSQTFTLASTARDETALPAALFGSPTHDLNYTTDGPAFQDGTGAVSLNLPLFVNGGASDARFPLFLSFSLFLQVLLTAYGHTSANGSEALSSRTGGPGYAPQQLPGALSFLGQTWSLGASTATIYDPGTTYPNYRYTLFTLTGVALAEGEFWGYDGTFNPADGTPAGGS